VQWSRSEPRALVWVPAVGCVLGAACLLAALAATDFYVSMGCVSPSHVADCTCTRPGRGETLSSHALVASPNANP
jgi:hypothetical protein